MARRRIADAPVSRLAIWARRCALFSLVMSALVVVIVRAGFLEVMPALATFAGALMFAVFGIVLAFGAFAVIWKDGLDGARYAVTALAIGVALLAYPGYLGTRAYRLPMINDITTDPIDPPRFQAQARPREVVEYAGLAAGEQQRMAYPDIEPLTVTANPAAAYDAAMQIIAKRKWVVVGDRRPQGIRRDYQIEAIAKTPIMGFREDVSLRIRPTRDGARIDVRSASRYGRHDLGSNASRIRSLLEDIDDIVTAKQERDERKATPKPAATTKAAAPRRP